MIARTTNTSALLLLAAIVAGWLSGCARMRARFAPAPEPARIIEPDTAGVSTAEQGLEVIVWTADDTYFRVGRALDRYTAEETVLPPGEAQAWRRAGLRVLAIPVDALDALLLETPPVAPVQRQRYGQMPLWSPIVRGPQLPAGVTGPSGRRLEPGRPRLIVRSWIEPDLSSGRAVETVRTELAIQIESAHRSGLLTDPAGRSIADAGEVIEELIAAVASDGRYAFVIVAESPDIEWADLPEPPPPATPPPATDPNAPGGPTPTPGEDPSAPTDPADPSTPAAPGETGGGDPARPATPYGPANPRPRTLGEWMLAAPGTPARYGRAAVGPRKVLMVLVPRLRAQPNLPTSPPTDPPTDPRPAPQPSPESVQGRTPSEQTDRSTA